jgi:hypothetical protein
MTKRLFECRTDAERIEVVSRDLMAGKIWTEPSLWLAGVDDPGRLMAKLPIAARVTRQVQDASGTPHTVAAWELSGSSGSSLASSSVG